MRGWVLAVALLAAAPAVSQPLPALRAQRAEVTVSGVSSGAFMAVQFHVAHSAMVSGLGAIAGGPYYCAQGSLFVAMGPCMRPAFWWPAPPLALLRGEAAALAQAGSIDPLEHLRRTRVWLFHGTNDAVVAAEVVQALQGFYAGFGASVRLVGDKPAGHGMVTEDGGTACGATEPPFLIDCDYDAAGALLAELLGKLAPPAAAPRGRLATFDQNLYATDARGISLDGRGFVYVPVQCEAGGCRIHVAFHGCRQGAAEIGERFVRDAGYNRWADTNRLVVLYPQAIRRYSPFVFNPRGCWDWWGYTSPDYHTKSGAQALAVRAMLERLMQ